MRRLAMIGLGIALVVGGVAPIGFGLIEADAAHIAIHSGRVSDTVTTISPGDEVTWINATGNPVIHMDFESPVDSQGDHRLFTSSTTLRFSRPGVYPYTVYVGARALTLRGTIVVR